MAAIDKDEFTSMLKELLENPEIRAAVFEAVRTIEMEQSQATSEDSEIISVDEDGRFTLPQNLRKKVNVHGRSLFGCKAFVEATPYGPEKILLRVMSCWVPTKANKGLVRTRVTKNAP
jgi:hypothetical protein